MLNYLFWPTVLGTFVAAASTYTNFDDGKGKKDGWDLAWSVYSNAIKGSVWYLSIPYIHFQRNISRKIYVQ